MSALRTDPWKAPSRICTLWLCTWTCAAGVGLARAHEKIEAALRPFVESNEIAGAVAWVADAERVLDVTTVGWADQESKRPMTPDTLFWIASMTKPMTAALIMMLQDERKLTVDDPVERYLPEFQNLPPSKDGTCTPPWLRHLLTHTSGLETVPCSRWDAPLAEAVAAYATRPLRFPPGSKWEYSNGGINTLGRIVEVVEGRPFAEVLQRRLLDPLEMRNTTFWPRGEQLGRLATSYARTTDGRLVATNIYFFSGPLDDPRRTPWPAGGLFSTAEDYARFLQMLLNGGVWRGRRLLSVESVAAMTQTQTGELATGFVPGMSFGFGVGVVREPTGVTAALSPGSFGHGGAYGTQGWVDPVRRRIYVLMIQRQGLRNADGSEIRRAFQDAALEVFSPR